MTGHKDCPVCGRIVVEVGEVNRIEAAHASGDGYVSDVACLVRGARRLRNLDRLATLAIVIDDFVTRPSRLRANEVNDLGAYLWELKAGTLRVPFFGAECPGEHTASGARRRLVLPGIVRSPASSDRAARFTHVFEKRTQRTPRWEIDKALAIKRQDRR